MACSTREHPFLQEVLFSIFHAIVNNSIWPKHLYALDISRGIASLSVVLWHWQHFAYQGSALAPNFTRDSQPLYNFLRLFYEKGHIGVYYFFLLSGFIFFWHYKEAISTKKVGAWEFALHRFSRLYPLHALTLVGVALMQFFYTRATSHAFVYPFNDLYHFILHLLFASDWGLQNGYSFNAPVWSVSIEILLYLQFFLVAVFLRSGAIFCLLTSIIASALSILFKHPLFGGMAMFFLGGFIFYSIPFIVKQKSLFTKALLALTSAAWIGVFVNFYLYEISSIFTQFGSIGKMISMAFTSYFLLPLTVISLILVELRFGAFARKLSWIGDITYSSYLLHFPLQLLFALAAYNGLINNLFFKQSAYFLLFFSILLPVAYLTFIYFERPAQSYLRSKLLHK